MSRDCISVIIPTWRRAALLGRAVESVLGQSWRPLQLIVVDDGSGDGTQDALEALRLRAAEAGMEAVFVCQRHAGVSSARNTGLRLARGAWIAFLDDDDWWLPPKLERQMAELERTGADAACCLTFTPGQNPSHDPSRLLRGRDAARFVARQSNAKITTLLFRRALLDCVGLFDESLAVYEDEEWKARLVHEACFCAIDEALVAYERGSSRLSRAPSHEANLQRDDDFMRHLMLMRERCAQRRGWSEPAWQARAAHVFDECAKHRLYVGDIEGARELYARGLEICGPIQALPKLKTKLRKAWWMSWLGLKPRHPKLHAQAAR